jgi:hypothetical protein
MQEFFFTILTVWVIWKLFNVFTRSAGPTYQQNTHHHYYREKQKDQVRVETKKAPTPKIPSDEGEYVDFEEVK